MPTIKLLLGILCFVITGSIRMLDRPLLNQSIGSDAVLRSTLVKLAQKELGTREKTNSNDGQRVEQYLAAVHLKRGQPYCAAFISFIFKEAGCAKPRSGWSPDLFPSSRISKSVLPGNILGIYFPEYKRIAHVGLIVGSDGDWLTSVEGNTNLFGSREGEGVYLKQRHIRTIYSISDWLKERRSVR